MFYKYRIVTQKMSSSDTEDIICGICRTIVEEEDAIKPCKCDNPIHYICLVDFIKYRKELLGLEAKCTVCSQNHSKILYVEFVIQ